MYDVVIIGAGPAGISASLYTQRANLKTLVIYKDSEISSLQKANEVSNYYGFEQGIKGEELYEKGIKQAENLGVEIFEEEVTNIRQEGNKFKVETLKNKFDSKTVIIATGNKRNKPNIKGIELFEGKGVSYCAICDGFFFKNKNVAIIGNGDYAISETIDLQNIVKSVTILTNGQKIPEYRAQNVYIVEKEIKEVIGEKRVEEIKFKDNTKMKIDGIFVAQGVAGSVEFAKKLGAKIKNDRIVVNDCMETNIKGLYACGDCTGGLYQISKSIYEGTKAGLQAINYLMSF